MKRIVLLILIFLAAYAAAQNPASQSAPTIPVNAKYVNGVAPGYAPTVGTGLILNVGPGTTNCNGTMIIYAGGTLTLTASTTNYVYLNTASSCAVTFKTTAFTSSDIPLATVVVGSSTLTSIIDDRTPFSAPIGASFNPASPGPIGGTTPNAGTFTTLTAAATVSGNVNTVLDLKAKFGASGSQQTMTCTTVATTTALSICSGGDFKSGQWVYIQGAGGLPTISAPVAPTLACTAVNSGSCTGSVVYGYKIVAVQAAPNGALTASSTAATITQAAQTPQAGVNSGRAYDYTTVSGYGVTGAAVYAVYKSINSGPYNFYTFTTATSFKDYGHMNGHGTFGCGDLGFPCTAPAAAVPNDVFATITGSGASWTLSALPYPPKYGLGGTSLTLNGSSTFPFTPATSGTFTVQHDDTPAFVAAWHYVTANPGFYELHIPSDPFNLHGEDEYGGGGMVMHLNNLDNVVISGNGDTSRLYQSGDRSFDDFLIGGCGYNSVNPPGNCTNIYGGASFNRVGNYSVVDPVNAGTYSFTTTTAADASNFPAGSYVQLGGGSSAGYPYNMYAEMNLVTSSDATSGIVTLAYPVNKPYTATLPAPYSNCASCAGAPTATPILPRPVATHIKMRDFWYRGPNTFFGGNAMDYVDQQNLTMTVTQVELQGLMRHRKFINNRVKEDPIGVGGSLFCEAASASSDYECKGNVYNGQSTVSGQMAGEGATNIVWGNNTFNFNGWEDNQYGSGPTGLIAGSVETTFNYSFTGSTVNASNGNLNEVIGAVDLGGNKCGFCTVEGNAFNIDTVGLGSPMASAALCLDGESIVSTAHIFNNDWNIGNSGGCSKQSASSSPLPALSTYTTASQSGNIALYFYIQSQGALVVPMSGNITGVNIGDPTGITGWYFVLGFQQPASGGPYTLPSDCTNANWFTHGGGSGIDCPNGPPVANPAASSTTYLWFLGDGTTLHFIGENYGTVNLTSTQTLTGKTVDGVTPTIFGYVDPTSSIQTQLNAKAATTALPIAGTTGSIGGGALLVNACASGTATVTGATTAMALTVTPVADPNTPGTQNYDWYAIRTGSNTVTVYVCALVAGTPAATTYNVRAIQ